MRAIGITCGIGSLVLGAKQAGFDVLANVEWREYYRARDAAGRNTFTENFQGATLHENLDHLTTDQIERLMGVELALGHPECGKYSVMSGTLRDLAERRQDPSDIPLFVDMVARLKPRFFVMDDLPRSFAAFPMSEYHRRLPGYDLYPEWVSNWGYGNVQKHRNRMFMLGSRKEEEWSFVPDERNSSHVTVRSVIEDLGEPRRGSNYPNHDPHVKDTFCYRALHMGGRGNRVTWGETAEYFRNRQPGLAFEYPDASGKPVLRVGFMRDRWDGPGYVLTGGNPIMHNVRGEPYTVRERARIQGFPDDFVFYGAELNERGEWEHSSGKMTLVKQTGKAMPVQFARYVSSQVAAHIRGEPFRASGQRVLGPNPLVDEAKRWYCRHVGYSRQDKACASCWMTRSCEIRRDKYQLSRGSKPPSPKSPPPRPPRPPAPPPSTSLQTPERRIYKAVETRITRV